MNIILEIGINHNGNVQLAKSIIDEFCKIKPDSIFKLQLQEPDVSVPDHRKNQIVNSIFGEINYIEYKRKLNLGEEGLTKIIKKLNAKKCFSFASAFDIPSLLLAKKLFGDFMVKIPSPANRNNRLIIEASNEFQNMILSCGMSSLKENLDSYNTACLSSRCNVTTMHCISNYPVSLNNLNLSKIDFLPKCSSVSLHTNENLDVIIPYLYSKGIKDVELHATLDTRMPGSDHKFSITPTIYKGIIDILSKLDTLSKKTDITHLFPGEDVVRARMCND